MTMKDTTNPDATITAAKTPMPTATAKQNDGNGDAEQKLQRLYTPSKSHSRQAKHTLVK
jgi:hypothetical protein